MNKLITLLLVLTLFACAEKESTSTTLSNLETNTTSSNEIPPVSSYFPKERTQVLVVGTFHFNYPGLDDHKTTPENQIDVLKEPKKSEVTELVEYIKRFKPTKIAIEATPGYKSDEKLRAYKDGGLRDKRDERVQLAMRIAADLKIDTLYGIDAESMRGDLYKKDSVLLKELTGNIDWDFEDPYWSYMETWMDEDDKLIPKYNLTDYFKHMNTKETHDYGYGMYLVSSFKSAGHQGADFLSLWWYNRNLRMFRNIQDINASPQDRVLVIVGNGHAAVLRPIIEASPEYEFVEFDSF